MLRAPEASKTAERERTYQSSAQHVGVSQNQGYHFGGPYNKDYSILGSILGSPYFGKLPCRISDSEGRSVGMDGDPNVGHNLWPLFARWIFVGNKIPSYVFPYILSLKPYTLYLKTEVLSSSKFRVYRVECWLSVYSGQKI